MSGNERREKILHILRGSTGPVSGTELSKTLDVSRQVIVQDIALLRANGTDILSTHTGYIVSKKQLVRHVVKVIHTDAEVAEELDLIVDLGGIIEDVFVYHKAYGVVKAPMNIRSRKDVKAFIEKIASGKSSLLMHTTSGYHYHTIVADSEESFAQIFEALQNRGFLAPLQDYEPINFWEESSK